MIDLCIINSPLFRDSNKLYDEDSLPPIGLGYIATRLKEQGFSVILIDAIADRIPLDLLIHKVIDINPKAIAINVFTTNLNLVQEFVEKLSPYKKRMIIGGLSTRTLYQEIFNWYYQGNLDVIFGDGELIVEDILVNNFQQEPAVLKDNKRFFKVNNDSPYFCQNISELSLDRNFFSNEPARNPKGIYEANIVASRGCIYNCAFCSAARSLNKDLAIRERTSHSLIAEIRDIIKFFPEVESIRVLDDLFLKGEKCIDKAIDVFNPFELEWRSMAHVLTFQGADINKLKKLKASGCNELFIGIESGSPKILKSIHKTHKVEKIRENLFKALEAGINLKGYFIYGFPNETEDDFKKTYSLACELKEKAEYFGTEFRTSVFQFRPYHGTELFHELHERGVKTSDMLEVQKNDKLSELVGRIQFNFHSGNYSEVSTEILQDYMYKTINLSTLKDWGLE